MFANVVNGVAVILGSLIGLLFRKGLPEKLSDAIMKGLGLCTIIIGIQGAVKESNPLILIIATVVGIAIGESLRIDGRVNAFTERIAARFAGDGQGSQIANAFITACLITSVGAMVIVGPLNAGLDHDYAMLYTKSLLDFITCIMLAATLGIGVMFSAAFTFLFQGVIVLLAQFIAPYLSDALITEISCTGSLMILAIGLNMIDLTKFKVLNFLPGLLIVPLAMYLMQVLGIQ